MDTNRLIITIDTNECLLVEGVNSSGYGHHRRKYERVYGKLPKNKVLDHLCRNRACQNLDHLEVVTYSENTLRGLKPLQNKQRERPTHCPSGHSYEKYLSIRTYSRRERGGRDHIQRYCKECKRIKTKQWYKNKRAQATLS